MNLHSFVFMSIRKAITSYQALCSTLDMFQNASTKPITASIFFAGVSHPFFSRILHPTTNRVFSASYGHENVTLLVSGFLYPFTGYFRCCRIYSVMVLLFMIVSWE